MKNYPISNMLFNYACKERKPINGTFELTSNCNFNCKMCYVHSCKKKSSDAPPEDWKRVIDEACDAGLIYALITGGEPLTHRNFTDIYSKIYKKGIVSVLNTNGYLLDDTYISFLKKAPPSRINITLYGTDDETYRNLCGVSGGFSQVEKNIKKLKENGFNLNLNLTFVKSNIHAAEDMVRFAELNNLHIRPSTYIFPSSENETNERLSAEDAAKAEIKLYSLTHTQEELKKWAENVFMKYEAAKKEKPRDSFNGTTCRAGKSSYWIHSDGQLSFCGIKSAGNELNVFKDGFIPAWEQAVKAADKVRNPDACLSCNYRFICRRCYAMLASENVLNENIDGSYTCLYYKRYTEELVNIYFEG